MLSNLIQLAAAKLPTMLGGGILGVSVVGLSAAVVGFTLGMAGEVLAAGAGMYLANRYA